jgi:hypothetical protein
LKVWIYPSPFGCTGEVLSICNGAIITGTNVYPSINTDFAFLGEAGMKFSPLILKTVGFFGAFLILL